MKQTIKRTLLLSTTLFISSTVVAGPNVISLKKLRSKVLKEKFVTDKFGEEDIFSSRFASWGIQPSNKKSAINLKPAWSKFTKKKEIVVAVIDTGIDPNHPFLKDNIHVTYGKRSASNYGMDFSKNRKSATRPIDSHGHGTHVSGIVKSVFPAVKILPLKYYNRHASGKDNLNSTIKALEYAVNQGVDIINYSGGGPEPDLAELEILKKAQAKGILIVAAAGNEESNIDKKENAYFPASYKLNNIITVTAHDRQLRILNSSNYGKNSVDLSAPGHRIKSAYPHSKSGFLTGTSQATAFVSGVAAMIKSQFPDLNARQLKQILTKSAKKEISFVGKTKSEGKLDATRAQSLAAKVSRYNKDKKGFAKKYKSTTKRDLANTKKSGKIIYRIKK